MPEMTVNAPILNLRVLRLHCENAAFLAAQWPLAQDSPAHRMVDLYDLEDRLSAHLEALALAGPVALDLALEGLATADAGANRGELHVAAALALRLRAGAELAQLLPDPALTMAAAEPIGLAAAMLPPALIAPRLRRWLDTADPVAVAAGLVACRQLRADPGAALPPLIAHPDPQVATHAANLAGELGRVDLLPHLQRRIAFEVGIAAARAAALLGDRGAAPTALADRGAAPTALAERLTPACPADQARQAAELLPLILPRSEARALIAALSRDPRMRRWSIVACAALGDAELLTGLITLMSDPVEARIAGAAFCQITGARMGAENLELAQFPEEPDDGPADPAERFIDTHLYWPDPDRIRDWLAPRATRMAAGERLLLGLAAWTHPAPPDLPNDAAHRSQLDLRAWALEIACRSPEAPLPNHRAPVRLAPRGFARP
jgi:uncharacterized protein (TIGR02270 family)